MPVASKVGARGQITLPKEMRERYQIEPGASVQLWETDDGILIRRPPSGFRGALKSKIDLDGLRKDVKGLRTRS